MIYGLVAAFGWGLTDYFAAISGRRIGSLPAVIVGQILSFSLVAVLFATSDASINEPSNWWWIAVLNGAFAMAAYASHYHALELGPVSVVSPIGSGYAVVGVTFAIVLFDERPSALALAGMAATVIGTILVSTDIKAMRAGLAEHPPSLPWAAGSAVGFGLAGLTLGMLVREAGSWQGGLLLSRAALLLVFVPFAIARRREFRRMRPLLGAGVAFALIAGAADALGVSAYSLGADQGYLSIVLAASAVFPLIAVVLSFFTLHERLVTNQYVGIGVVAGGLLLLGLGS